MQNIALVAQRVGNAPKFLSNAASIDSPSRLLFFVSAAHQLCVYDLERTSVVKRISLAASSVAKSRIVDLQYLPEFESVCIITASGEFLLVPVDTSSSSDDVAVELVGMVECGIAAACWSPDQELCAIITNEYHLLMMTTDWDVLFEVLLDDEVADQDAPDENACSVSWRGDGQFFVTSYPVSAKSSTPAQRLRVWSRNCEPQSKSEAGVSHMSSVLCWKPEGDLIASLQTKFKGASQEIQDNQIIFFERNGLRHGEFSLFDRQCEVVSISWNSDSEILGVLQRSIVRPKEHTLTLWVMSNYHWYLKQSFRFDDVASFRWDPENPRRLCVFSLATTSSPLEEEKESDSSSSPSVSETATTVHWIEISSKYQCSEGGGSTCAVIDGDRVQLTPFAKMVVPPPMSACTLRFNSVVQILALSSFAEDRLCVMLEPSRDDGSHEIHFFDSYEFASRPSAPPTPSFTARFQPSGFVRAISWVSERRVLVVESPRRSSSSTDALLDVQIEEDGTCKITKRLSIDKSDNLAHTQIAGIRISRDAASAFVQLWSGKVLRYTLNDSPSSFGDHNQQQKLEPFGAFPVPCPADWDVVGFGAGNDTHHNAYGDARSRGATDLVLVGRDVHSKLYLDGKQFHHFCTSFSVHPHMLVFITGGPQNVMYFLDRRNTVEEHLNGEFRPDANSYRFVERGSQIVSIVPVGEKVILQAPRGNLEGVFPRALVLDSVSVYLSRREYMKAFGLLRKHRIDMNLIYDHNPDAFLKNLGLFLSQVSNVDYLNNFITSLSNDNAIETQFPSYRRAPEPADDDDERDFDIDSARGDRGSDDMNFGRARQKGEYLTSLTDAPTRTKKPVPPEVFDVHAPPKPCKIDLICRRMREEMSKIDADHYLLSILTCFMKETKPKYEEALSHVRELRDANRASAGDGSSSSISAQSALEYVIFLADINELYKVALGMYDFDLVMMVIQCGKDFDPKEYLPFLSKLEKLSEFERRYEIDVSLKRHESALRHLSKCGAERFEGCLKLVHEHQLHDVALQIWPHFNPSDGSTSPEWVRIMQDYAESLVKAKNMKLASQVYSAAGLKDKALQCLVDACEWQLALYVAKSLGHDDGQIVSLASNLAQALRSNSNHLDAARLTVEYCQDVDLAMQDLMQGRHWSEALRLCALHNRMDLIDTSVRPAIVEEAQHRLDEIAKARGAYEYSINRLRTVRYRKSVASGGDGEDGDGDDRKTGKSEMSDTASTMSGFSWSSLASGSTQFSQFQPKFSMLQSHGGGQRDANGLTGRQRARKARREKKLRKKIPKEGDPREEGYLVKQLTSLTASLVSLRSRVPDLIHSLILFEQFSLANKLRVALQELLDIVVANERFPFVKKEQPKLDEDGPTTAAQTQATAKASPEWPLEIYREQDLVQPLSSASDNHTTTFTNMRFLDGLETSESASGPHDHSHAFGVPSASSHDQNGVGGDILSTGEMQLPLDFDL